MSERCLSRLGPLGPLGPLGLLGLLGVLGLLLSPALMAQAAPVILPQTQGGWMLSRLPPILAEAEVRSHLTTGMTATFSIRVQARNAPGARSLGGARVDVRYELWDEVFHVVAAGIDGRGERRVLASFEELEAWWRDLRPAIFAGSDPAPPGPWQVRVSVDLLPFSQAEQDDTQRWFSESLQKAARSSAEEVARAADDQAENLNRVLSLVMATSIQRRPLATWEWSLEIAEGAASSARPGTPP